jgi:hypothetical protein
VLPRCLDRVNYQVQDLCPGIVTPDDQPVLVLILFGNLLADCCGATELHGVAVLLEVVEAGEDF